MIEFATNIVIGMLAFAGSLIATLKANEKTEAIIEYRIKQLEEKVNKHNNLVERMYEVETKLALNEEKIKVVNNRIDDIN